MSIRAPNYADVERLLELGARMHEESAYAFLPYERAKVRRLIESYIEDRESRCGLVAERDGLVIGMFGGYLIDYLFCDELLACDEILFVDPQHRGGIAVLRLIRAFRRWAADRGARELCLGISTGVGLETTGRLYERLGFTRVGSLYKLRLPDG